MKRTGVIVGINQHIDHDTADMYRDLLMLRYPGVNFTLLGYGDSITFEYDDSYPSVTDEP
jgi:hypothetical protein